MSRFAINVSDIDQYFLSKILSFGFSLRLPQSLTSTNFAPVPSFLSGIRKYITPVKSWEIARATFLSGIDEGQLRQFIVDARNIISLSFCVTPSPTKMNRIIFHLPLFPIILSKLDGSSIYRIDRVHFSVISVGMTTKLQPTDFLIN